MGRTVIEVAAGPRTGSLDMAELLEQRVQVGMIIPWGHNTPIPGGYEKCDGGLLLVVNEPRLFALIGNNFGSDTPGVDFRKPDMRGRFPRGVAEGQSEDPDAGTRTAKFANGNTGDNVGSYQEKATALPNTNFTSDDDVHNHSVTGGNHSHTYVRRNGNQAAERGNDVVAADELFITKTTGGSGAHSHTVGNDTHSHTVDGGGDADTRPPNTNVIFLIKT